MFVFRSKRICKGKSKAVPLQAWSGPEGSRKLRFPDYITTAQDGGKVVSPTDRPRLPPGNAHGTHFCCGPGSSVGIATDHELDGPGSNPGGDEIFRPSRPALGPTQPPIKWVPGFSRGVK